MRCGEFLDWLEAHLAADGVAVRRWPVDADQQDLEIRTAGGRTAKLRIVRTSPTAVEPKPDAAPATRAAGTPITRSSGG